MKVELVACASNKKLKPHQRNWYKFHNENSLGSDCQLISTVNAYYYLTGKHIKTSSQQYQKLVDLVGCRHGAAINIEKAYNKLGLVLTTAHNRASFWDIPNNLPVETSVWHPRYGFHSVLIINKEHKSEALQVLNFKYATTTMGWIFAEDFFIYANHHPLAMFKVLNKR